MTNNLWTSPFFIISIGLTLVAGYYAYIYLPRRMKQAYRQSLLTLARAVETKDMGALGHGERVAHMVVDLAREMGVPERDLHLIEYAALLQDIGNVHVPHSILNKTEHLTPEEFEILRSHAVVGANMAEQVTFIKSIAPIIRHHHEAWDGSGYPDGLTGSEIPLGARILAICTAYDSMTHARAYRGHIDEGVAIRELRAGSGTLYDPLVVNAFLKVVKKNIESIGR